MTEKQKQFCDEYLANGLNATQAYLAVYKNVKSEDAARTNASRLLTNANVREYIDVALAKIHDEKTMDAKEVMERLTAIGREETTDQLLTMDGDVKEVKSKTQDRIRALELIGKAYGMFKDKVEMEVATPVFAGESDLED
ncbi:MULTISPECIES: terminase small subunit [Allobaculum]|uniref:terminase small subunit n=1 Tax=Allobaculum TaxID=174708 RepID=UPI001E5D6E16|nr:MULTISPECIES: terminase small subunit [Allobaculum]UNT92225.1 terminase small subunit [Allobaculum sp. Allo2]